MFLTEFSNSSNKNLTICLIENIQAIEDYNNFEINFIQLEHSAIINESVELLQEGLKDLWDKLIDLLRRIYRFIADLINRIITFIKRKLGLIKTKDLKKKIESDPELANKKIVPTIDVQQFPVAIKKIEEAKDKLLTIVQKDNIDNDDVIDAEFTVEDAHSTASITVNPQKALPLKTCAEAVIHYSVSEINKKIDQLKKYKKKWADKMLKNLSSKKQEAKRDLQLPAIRQHPEHYAKIIKLFNLVLRDELHIYNRQLLLNELLMFAAEQRLKAKKEWEEGHKRYEAQYRELRNRPRSEIAWDEIIALNKERERETEMFDSAMKTYDLRIS